jgi:hypothetical protein
MSRQQFREAELADGTILEFPAETTDAVMQAAVKKYIAGQSKAKPSPAKGYGNAEGNYTQDMTRGGIAANQAVNVLESYGVDPSSPIVGTAKNVVGGLKRSFDEGYEAVPQVPGAGFARTAAGALNVGKDLAAGLLQIPAKAAMDLLSGNAEKAARGAGTFSQMVVPAAKGAQVATRAAKSAAVATSVPERLMTRAAVNRTPVRSGPPTTGQVLGDAIRDVPAATVGAAIAGPPGGAVAVILNRLRRSQPFRNMKAGTQERIAKWIAEGQNGAPPASAAAPEPVPFSIIPEGHGIQPAESTLMPGRYNLTPEMDVAGVRRLEAQGRTPEPYATPEGWTPATAAAPEPAGVTASPTFQPAPSVPKAPSARDVMTAMEAISPTARRQRSTMFNAPKLLQEAPDLIGLRKGEAFDRVLTENFNRVERSVIEEEAAVPRTTTVPKSEITGPLKMLRKEAAADPNLGATVAKLDKLIAEWSKLPNNVPWEQFLTGKRSFFDEINPKSAPMFRAYGVFMDASNKVSEGLSKANKSYSIVRRAMDDANMETSSKVNEVTGQPHRGTRIKQIGKAKKIGMGSTPDSPTPPAATAPVAAPKGPAPRDLMKMPAKEALETLGAKQTQNTQVLQFAEFWMDDFAKSIEGGDTHIVGKAQKLVDPERRNYEDPTDPGAGRHTFSGGYKEGTPLRNFKQSPGELAAAIRKGKGKLYEEIREAFTVSAADELAKYYEANPEP